MDQPDPVLRSSYQRTPARSFPSASTVWLMTTDWWSAKLRYCSRAMRRLLSASTCWVVPGCAMQSRKVGVQFSWVSNAAVFSVSVRLKVELAGVVQSTWNERISSRSLPPSKASSNDIANGLGAPAGGGLAPSQSAGTMRRPRPSTPPDTATLSDWNVAGDPDS